MTEAITFHSLAQSNLPTHQKSRIMQMLTGMRGGGMARRVGAHGIATVNVVRHYAEGMVVGMGAGAAHVMLPHGLDLHVKNATVPLDLVGSLLLAGLAAASPSIPSMSSTGLGTDATAMSSQLGSIFFFRKSFDFLAARQKKNGKTVGGTFGGEGDNDWSQPSMGADVESGLLNAVSQL